MSESYRIVRNYFNYYRELDNEVVATGLTLEEAQEWCRDPETSSRTCKKPQNVKRTEEKGPWFDGYELEKPAGEISTTSILPCQSGQEKRKEFD